MHLFKPAALALGAVTAVAAIAGCGGGAKPQAAPSTTASVYSPPPCPSVAANKPAWPKWLPADLPKPPNATIIGETTTGDGIRVVRFSTPTSLRDSVLFIVNAYPKAGYALGRGDAEATEADAPFVHGSIRGLTRISQLEQCKTLWLTATASQTGPVGTSPLLPSRTPTASASPLPFG